MKNLYYLIILLILFSCSNDRVTDLQTDAINTSTVFAPPMMMTDNQIPSGIDNHNSKKVTNSIVLNFIPEIKPATYNLREWNISEGGIDVLFIMEGFQASEEYKFYAKVNELIESMHEKEPFASNLSSFNFWTYNTPSNESGISILSHESNPLTPVLRDTAWNIYRNRIGLGRYTDIPKEKFKELTTLLTHPKTGFFDGDVYSVFIVNDAIYAGSGEFKKPNSKVTNAIVTTSEQFSVSTFKALFLHEFGHSFGDLDDEYQHQPTFDRINRYEKQLMNLKRKDNTSEDDVTDRKWDHLLPNPAYIKGTRWGDSEYRSSLNSLMRSVVLHRPFGQLNEILLQKRINEAIGQ